MSQLTIETQGTIAVPRGGRRRPMRNERMVSLRSAMPVGLVTLRHDVPEYLQSENLQNTTPKVDSAQHSESVVVDTPVRKGGKAQW